MDTFNASSYTLDAKVEAYKITINTLITVYCKVASASHEDTSPLLYRQPPKQNKTNKTNTYP